MNQTSKNSRQIKKAYIEATLFLVFSSGLFLWGAYLLILSSWSYGLLVLLFLWAIVNVFCLNLTIESYLYQRELGFLDYKMLMTLKENSNFKKEQRTQLEEILSKENQPGWFFTAAAWIVNMAKTVCRNVKMLFEQNSGSKTCVLNQHTLHYTLWIMNPNTKWAFRTIALSIASLLIYLHSYSLITLLIFIALFIATVVIVIYTLLNSL